MKHLLTCILISSCIISCIQREYVVVDIENPEFRPNTAFIGSENISLPRFDSLKVKYQLDTVIAGETDELKKILLLREWIRKVIGNDDHRDHYSGKGHPQKILDAALQGEKFHCAHYMSVQNAIMNAYGFVTRCIGSGPGEPGFQDQHHGINEIWLNDYNKWFLSDAKYDHHFEKDGIPLSALEVREEYLKNKAADIVMVKGAQRISVNQDPVTGGTTDQFAKTYSWIEWELHNNKFSAWPEGKAEINVYQDTFFKNNTWLWGGKPHWAYNTDYMKPVDDRKAIEWTPNTITSTVSLQDDIADISLISNMPNFREYQMKELPSGDWQKTPKKLNVKLIKDKHELAFRAVNLAGVAGPEHRVVITAK